MRRNPCANNPYNLFPPIHYVFVSLPLSNNPSISWSIDLSMSSSTSHLSAGLLKKKYFGCKNEQCPFLFSERGLRWLSWPVQLKVGKLRSFWHWVTNQKRMSSNSLWAIRFKKKKQKNKKMISTSNKEIYFIEVVIISKITTSNSTGHP